MTLIFKKEFVFIELSAFQINSVCSLHVLFLAYSTRETSLQVNASPGAGVCHVPLHIMTIGVSQERNRTREGTL